MIKRIAEVDIPANTGDFRLMSRRVVNNVVALKEGHGFLRGLVGLVGFRQTSVLVRSRPARGRHQQVQPTVRIARDRPQRVVGFSRYPLQLISFVGSRLPGFAFLLAVVYLGLKIGGVEFPLGNPTVVIVVAFFSGIQLLSLGVIGEYVGRIYDETRSGRSTSSSRGTDSTAPTASQGGERDRRAETCARSPASAPRSRRSVPLRQSITQAGQEPVERAAPSGRSPEPGRARVITRRDHSRDERAASGPSRF